jgi:two-component system phosphate regulon response regulator PhoB
MTTLIIAKDPGLCEAITIGLQMRWPAMQVRHALTAADAWTLFCLVPPDLILVDSSLPSRASWELVRRMRAVSRVPIMLLLPRGAELDKVSGLEAGADDYLAQPFSHLELFARIGALLRRVPPEHALPAAVVAPRYVAH